MSEKCPHCHQEWSLPMECDRIFKQEWFIEEMRTTFAIRISGKTITHVSSVGNKKLAKLIANRIVTEHNQIVKGNTSCQRKITKQ